jgi:heme-degrading monooxygenase HmoA
MHTGSDRNAVFKVDRFVVPARARDEFLERARAIRDFLDTQDGCLKNVVLEQPGDSNSSNVITIVEWRDAEAFAKARAAAAARYALTGFKPEELIERLGIKAEIAKYSLIG